MNITIYHNSKCSKSRQTLTLIEKKGIKPRIVNYLEQVPSFSELKELIDFLEIKPIELVRTKEIIWQEQFKGKELSDDEIIQAMVDNHKLIERPIVVNGIRALICRPPEKVLELI